MTIRPLDLLDLPALYRFRSEAISLDSARLLTRGNPLGAIGVMAYANPRRHIYSAVARDDEATLAGGVIHNHGQSYARLLYLAPASEMDNEALPGLVENLAAQAGMWGALHVVAETEELSPAFIPLRKAGFSVYAWQRIWDVTELAGEAGSRPNGDGAEGKGADPQPKWRRVESVNLPAVQNLHHQIVPPLLQVVETPPRSPNGFLCNEGGRAYVGVSSGMVGIVLFPLIHPEVTDVGAKLGALIRTLPNRGGRPVYVCVRSYEAWLEPVLEDLGAMAGDRQAIMVKHLAHLVKAEQAARVTQPANISVPASGMSRLAGKK